MTTATARSTAGSQTGSIGFSDTVCEPRPAAMAVVLIPADAEILPEGALIELHPFCV